MTDRLKTGLAALLAVTALVLLVLSVRSVQPDDGLQFLPPDRVRPADDFTLPDAATGLPVHLAAEANAHPVVLDFWATWCGPCRQELPHLSALARKYRGRVAFYGVNADDRPADITAFAHQFAMPFPTLVDVRREAAGPYGANALPTLVVIDRHSHVRVLTQGYGPAGDMEAALSRILDTLLAGN